MSRRYLVLVLAVTLSMLALPTVAPAAEEPAEKAEIYHSLSEKKAAGLAREIAERVTLSGLIEIEAFYENLDPNDIGVNEKSSDIVLATAQFGFGIDVSETVSGALVLLYEEGPDSQLEVDEATVNFDNGQYFSRVGRQYLPFGAFVSHFLSDPILLDLGETRATALLGGVRIGSAEFSLFAFNGDADEAGEDDHVDDFGASLNFGVGEILECGASYLSDLADSDAELTYGVVNVDERTYTEKAAGWSAFLALEAGVLDVTAEILAAVDKLVDLGTDFDEPQAWNVEFAWDVNDNVELALRAEGSDELAKVPELQYGVCFSRGLGNNLNFSFEYLHGEFDASINAPLDTRDVVTAQLAMEF